MTILAILESGPKSYAELKQACPSPTLDYQLNRLMKQKRIRHVFDVFNACRFSLPAPPPVDLPLPTYKAAPGLCKPRKNQYSFDKGGRKRCAVCGNRKGRTRFMYGGKIWGACFDCSRAAEQPAQTGSAD